MLIGQRLLIIICILNSFLATAQIAHDGILDLRSADLSKQSIKLDGEWEFFWDELLEPEQITKKGKIIPFPSLWNDLEIDGKKLQRFGYATYRLKILLPQDRSYYTLHVEDMFSSFRLYVNGELVYKNGVVAKNREDYIPEWKPDYIPLRHLKDTSEIVLQIANFDHRKGGINQSLEIGETDFMKDEELEILSYDLILTGSLFMGGLFLLGLFLFGHHDKAILFFSVFCITYSYRIIGSDYYTLHHLIGGSWHVLARLEYISLFISVFLFSKFVYRNYPDEIKPIYFKILNTICITFSVATIILPANIFTHFTNPFLVVLVVYLLLTMRIYLGAFLKKKLGSTYALISTCVVITIFLYSIMVFLGILPEWSAATFWGYVLFFFSQSLILSFRFAYFLKFERDRAEKASQIKSEFLSTISHEIRTPMNAVIGLTNFLLEDKPKASQLETLNTLKFSAKNLLVIINDILDFSKIEAKKIVFENRPVNIHELMSSLKRVFLPAVNAKKLDLVFNIDADIPELILCDPTRTSQILTNLINNAVKFTNAGSITVNLQVINKNKEEVEVRFEVRDTGIGIEIGKLSAIFESFTQASSSTTREFGGTGLGLTITRQLLQLQGVELLVESDEGKGSVFYFIQVFEIAQKPAERGVQHFEPVIPESKQPDSNPSKLLVVEDNEVNIMVVKKFLKKWGFEIIIAKNGKEALEKYQADSEIALILMDLQMPVMDGYEASRKFRSLGVTKPIIALTASALMEDQIKIKNAGMDDYVTKPFDPEILHQKISQYINRKPI